jgi:hypothetical protein
MWIYNQNEIHNLSDFPEDSVGFIYKLTLLENGVEKYYIGKKQLFNYKTVKLTQKEILALTDKRKSKVKKVPYESNWLAYTGSSKTLNNLIKEGTVIVIRKEILEVCPNKMCLYYKEVKWQFQENVLENENYYNDNIMSKFFKSKI